MAAGLPTDLTTAVRVRVVLRHVGDLLLVLGALTAAPLVVAILAGDLAIAGRLAVVAASLGGTGAAFRRLRAPRRLQANEAIVVGASMFLLAPAVLAWPLAAAGLSWIDALFEAVSGVTTTGLTTLDVVEDRPAAFLFMRAWMQWFGGLGIVVLGVALLIHPGPVARRLGVPGPVEADLVGSTRSHARQMLGVYLGLTAAGFALLWLVGGDPFRAVLHALAGVSTGGFAPRDDSLASLTRLEQIAVMSLGLLGALPLALYAGGPRGRTLATDVQVRAILIAVLALAVALVLLGRFVDGASWSEALVDRPLLALSAQTTTGFSTLEPQALDAASRTLVIAAMLVGAGLGSTGGGMKILRLVILLRLLHLTIVRSALPPHSVATARLNGRDLEEDDFQGATCIVLLFLLVPFLSWLVFLGYGRGALDSLFEVASATGTVGLSCGLTAPDLPAPLKAVLCADMLFGRLEVFALLVVLYPRTWLGRRVQEVR